jgi:hypothetical protein
MKILMQMTITGSLCASLAAPSAAQSRQPLSLQVSGLFAKPFGGDYDDFRVGSGGGGEAQIRYTPGALSIGAGFQLTSHSSPGYVLTLDDGSLVDVSGVGAKIFGAFIEPRYVIFVGSDRIAPYVSARLSMLHYGTDANWADRSQPYRGTLNWNTTGLTANGGGGLMVRLTSRMNLDLGATYGYSSFGAYSQTIREQQSGASLRDQLAGGHGSNVVVRAGLAMGIGR